MLDINKVIAAPEYQFLWNNEHLGNRIMLLAFGGSHAHGTATEESDINLRGCAINSPSELLGTASFDRYLDRRTDTAVFSLFRLVQQLLSADFTSLELLGCKPEHYAVISPAGQKLLDRKSLFFTKHAASAYVGYTTALEEWLDEASARLQLGHQCSEKNLAKNCDSAVQKFNRKFRDVEEGAAKVYVDRSNTEGMSVEVFMDVNIKHCPLRDYREMLAALDNVIATNERTAKQRRTPDPHFMGKKMCTLLRMLYTCCDLLETGELVTFREKEREQLLEVRGGKFVLPQCKVAPEFKDLLQPLKERLNYALANTVLPEQTDLAAVDELLIELHRDVLAAAVV